MKDDDFSGHPAHEDPGLDDRRRSLARRIGIGAVVLLLLLVGFGAWQHYARHDRAEDTMQARQNDEVTVRTEAAKVKNDPSKLSLSGTMQPYDVATIYARATGYIAKRNADFGTPVHTGDVLAEIHAPDLDQQLSQGQAQMVQAQAALGQSQAQETLQRATNARTQILVSEGWQTKQQGDTDRLTLAADEAAVRVSQANLEAAKANMMRLQELASFEKVTAPFDGTVTDREVDVGSLVTADTNSGTALFSVARTNVLRVQVYVPQDSVFGLKVGDVANVTVPELSGRVFQGKISRMASALQEGTRTMVTQVDVDNVDNSLRAGSYCTVTFDVPQTDPGIVVPSQAIIFDSKGLSVAIMEDGKVRLRKVEVAQDNGAELQIRSGLKEGDQIILSPPIDIADGMPVKKAS